MRPNVTVLAHLDLDFSHTICNLSVIIVHFQNVTSTSSSSDSGNKIESSNKSIILMTHVKPDCLSIEGRPPTNGMYIHASLLCDFNLDPMTLIYKTALDILKMYLHRE